MAEPVSSNVVLGELIARPAQSKFSLAAHLRLSPAALDETLDDLLGQGLLVTSEATDSDSAVFYWASRDASQEIADTPDSVGVSEKSAAHGESVT